MNTKNYHQKKRFGQHWLVNNLILEKIKEVAELEEKEIKKQKDKEDDKT